MRSLDAFELREDSAYMDRADIVQYVGLPPQDAIYWILSSCLKELMRAGIISPIVSVAELAIIMMGNRPVHTAVCCVDGLFSV